MSVSILDAEAERMAVAAYHPLDLALPGAKLLDFRVARSVF